MADEPAPDDGGLTAPTADAPPTRPPAAQRPNETPGRDAPATRNVTVYALDGRFTGEATLQDTFEVPVGAVSAGAAIWPGSGPCVGLAEIHIKGPKGTVLAGVFECDPSGFGVIVPQRYATEPGLHTLSVVAAGAMDLRIEVVDAIPGDMAWHDPAGVDAQGEPIHFGFDAVLSGSGSWVFTTQTPSPPTRYHAGAFHSLGHLPYCAGVADIRLDGPAGTWGHEVDTCAWAFGGFVGSRGAKAAGEQTITVTFAGLARYVVHVYTS